MENENKDFLISAIDQYGLETAPVGPSYFGVENDWFVPIINKEGSFEFKINSEETMYWDSFSTIEYKPEGTDIKYDFSVLDENGNYQPFVEDFYSLDASKGIKVKVTMTGFNDKMPSLYDMRVLYHFKYEEKNYKKTTRIFDTPEKVIDEYILKEGETIDEIIITDSYITNLKPKTNNNFQETGTGIGNQSVPDIYMKDLESKISYEYSENGISYNPVTSFVDIPSGSYVNIIRECNSNSVSFNTPIVKVYDEPIIIQDAETPFIPVVEEQIPVPKDSEIHGKNWVTVQELALIGSSGNGQIAHWISVVAEDIQPEHTRILYRYATSNGFDWSPFKNNVSELSDSRMLKVYAILQVEKDYVEKVSNPEIIKITINSTMGIINLDTVKPTGVIKPIKDNNEQREDISTSSKIKWEYEAYDPQEKEIVEAIWGGDKRENYDTPGTYTVTLKLRNELNYWSDEIKFTFVVKDEKPVAVIGPEDRNVFSSRLPLSFDTNKSYDLDGDKIVKAEWGGDYKENELYAPGSYTIKLRVQDEDDNWSDWTTKEFSTIDSIFFGIGEKALDNNDTTYSQITGKQYITWDGNLENKVVRIYIKKINNGGYSTRFKILDAEGKVIPFIEAGTNVIRTGYDLYAYDVINTKIIIPEGATKIFIESFTNLTDVYTIQDYEDKTAPNNVSNITSTKTVSSITLNWTNPSDEDFDKVAIYKDGKFLCYNSGETFTDKPLYSNETHTYEIQSIDTTGNRGEKIEHSETTLKPEIVWGGLPPAAFDNNDSTYSQITGKQYITWDGNLENKVVRIYMKKINNGGYSTRFKILDAEGKIIPFMEAGTNVVRTGYELYSYDVINTKIIIPEGAAKLFIESFTNLTNVYTIQKE